MGCQRTLSINKLDEGDMPLDQTIYVPALDKLIGCRGKWLFKFNATTGAKEAEMRWATGLINESYLCAIGTTIYVAGWRGVIERYPGVGAFSRPDRSIFTVNGTTMALTGNLNVGQTEGSAFTNAFNSGFRNIVTDGTLIYGFSPFAGSIFSFNPANVAGTYTDHSDNQGETSILDLSYDATNAAIWHTQITSGSGGTSGIFVHDKTSLATDGHSTPISSTTNPTFLGFTYCPSNGKGYAVDYAGGQVYIINCNAAFPGFNNFTYNGSPIAIDAAAKPVKIKYNSVDGLIYVPGWSNDKVQAINPATNTVVATYTGFSDCHDVVFTPSKKFAVQGGAVGLREIA